MHTHHRASQVCARLAFQVVLLSVAGLYLQPSRGSAQEASPSTTLTEPTDPSAPSSPAHALFAAAVEEYEAGHYPEALALLRQAHAIEPTARTHRAIGMAAFGMRRYVVAVRALRDALTSTARPLDEAQRAHARELLARATDFVVVVRASVHPRDASLRIDGELPVLEPDGTTMLEVGRHTFTATHPEREPVALEVDLEPGSRELVLDLPPRVVLPPAQATAPSELLVSGGVLGIAAALTVAAASTTGILALSDRDVLAQGCDPFFCPEALRPVRDRARSLAETTDVLGSLAAGLGAASITLLVLGATITAPTSARASLLCSRAGCVGSIEGVF